MVTRTAFLIELSTSPKYLANFITAPPRTNLLRSKIVQVMVPILRYEGEERCERITAVIMNYIVNASGATTSIAGN
jgi:hypothetical protein